MIELRWLEKVNSMMDVVHILQYREFPGEWKDVPIEKEDKDE